MKKEKRRPQALPALMVRFGALLLALWLMCMALITLGVTQYVFGELTTTGLDFAEYVYMVGRFGYLYGEYPSDAWIEQRRQMPGVVEYFMNEAIAQSSAGISAPNYDFYPEPYFPDWLNILQGSDACETAVLFMDRDGNIIRESGDFLYFGYVTEAEWDAGSDVGTAYGWIDLGVEDDSRYGSLRAMYAEDKSLWDLSALRLTGYFKGSRFEPLAMDILTQGAYYDALESASPQGSDSDFTEENAVEPQTPDLSDSATTSGSGGGESPAYTISELDAMGLLAWEAGFDHTASAGRELATIYATHPGMALYEPKGMVSYKGVEQHENLLALLGTMGAYSNSGRNSVYSGASKFDLWDLVVFSSWGIRDFSEYDAASGDPVPEREYTILTALRASPLKIAMHFLKNVYPATFALAAFGFLLVRRSAKKHLIAPVQAVNQGIAEGWVHLLQFREKPPKWEEPYALASHYADTQDALRTGKNEIARLSTALEYAETAEQNRRQMTSSIAHELKTPLAIIHSYAEGLKEHIAEDKRDKYIDVILSETERLDGMVLEMLDLSRLEAGKVKLSRDVFSLIALTRTIFEKLEMAARAKELQIEFRFPEDFTITADESRIAQVIENFATNAIKYTPASGHIVVKIERRRDGALFSIENESAPLSAEALRKVWDTFYRADASRSSSGTGLGLAIAKNIIVLHGGRCAARNTKSGVEFSFTI